MKTVIISGARGYFGGVASCFFRSRGWKVLRAARHAGDELFFDLDQPERFAAMALDQPADLFIHAAAAHEVTCSREPYRAAAQNVSGTLAALDFAVANRISRFAYLSTFHVFGSPRGRLDETSTPNPDNVYGLSHLQAEECVEMYRRRSRIQGFSVRPANFFGMPDDMEIFNRWTLTPFAFPKEALECGEIVLKSPGHQRRNFVHVPAICELIERNADAGEPRSLLHAVGSETLSIRELAHLVAEVVLVKTGRKVTLAIPEGENTEPGLEFISNWESPVTFHNMQKFIGELVDNLVIASASGKTTKP